MGHSTRHVKTLLVPTHSLCLFFEVAEELSKQDDLSGSATTDPVQGPDTLLSSQLQPQCQPSTVVHSRPLAQILLCFHVNDEGLVLLS